MNILITQETDWLKRNPGQQHHLAELLSKRGHKICVIDYEIMWATRGRRELYSSRKVFNDVSKIYDRASVKVVRPSIVKIPWLDYVSLVLSHTKEIKRQIKEFVPDVIIGFSILNAYLGMFMAKKNNIPFVYYWNDAAHTLIPFKPFRPIGRMVESKTLKQADRVLTINEKLKELTIKMGATLQRSRVLRAGINIEQFNPNISGDIIRQQYGFGKEDIVLFFMGWLYMFSGLKELALRLAQIDNPNLKLLIVGEGDAYDSLKGIQEEYKLQDRMILTGKKPYKEIPAFVAASDICLLPAYPWESAMQDIVPIKLYEYMAMRKAVISTRLPGVMKEFGDGNGIIYVDRPEDVLGKANELVADGNLSELGAKAGSFVERNSWDNIADEFETILEETIKEKHNKGLSKRP